MIRNRIDSTHRLLRCSSTSIPASLAYRGHYHERVHRRCKRSLPAQHFGRIRGLLVHVSVASFKMYRVVSHFFVVGWSGWKPGNRQQQHLQSCPTVVLAGLGKAVSQAACCSGVRFLQQRLVHLEMALSVSPFWKFGYLFAHRESSAGARPDVHRYAAWVALAVLLLSFVARNSKEATLLSRMVDCNLKHLLFDHRQPQRALSVCRRSMLMMNERTHRELHESCAVSPTENTKIHPTTPRHVRREANLREYSCSK